MAPRSKTGNPVEFFDRLDPDKPVESLVIAADRHKKADVSQATG